MKWVGWRGLSQLGVCLEQASKGGRSSRSHWGQVSEEEAQPSPGWASPTRQASGCCWDLGGAKQQGWRGCGGQGPKGTLEVFLLEINCKKTDSTNHLANERSLWWELVVAFFCRDC